MNHDHFCNSQEFVSRLSRCVQGQQGVFYESACSWGARRLSKVSLTHEKKIKLSSKEQNRISQNKGECRKRAWMGPEEVGSFHRCGFCNIEGKKKP